MWSVYNGPDVTPGTRPSLKETRLALSYRVLIVRIPVALRMESRQVRHPLTRHELARRTVPIESPFSKRAPVAKVRGIFNSMLQPYSQPINPSAPQPLFRRISLVPRLHNNGHDARNSSHHRAGTQGEAPPQTRSPRPPGPHYQRHRWKRSRRWWRRWRRRWRRRTGWALRWWRSRGRRRCRSRSLLGPLLARGGSLWGSCCSSLGGVS